MTSKWTVKRKIDTAGSRIQALAVACCLAIPMALAAQNMPADPMNPGNPTSNSPTSPVNTPSATSGQMTPGMIRPNPNARGNFGSETVAPMGSMADSTAQDKRFLRDACEGGMAEVRLGQLASSKAESAQVKAFGQKMVTDHTQLNNDLKPFADRDGVAPPAALNAEDKVEYDKLNGLSGAAFDKEYVAFMQKDHKKDLMEFRREGGMTTNPQLKMAVSKGEKVVAEHKQMIDKISASMGSPSGM